jgi:hypothetical protein
MGAQIRSDSSSCEGLIRIFSHQRIYQPKEPAFPAGSAFSYRASIYIFRLVALCYFNDHVGIVPIVGADINFPIG